MTGGASTTQHSFDAQHEDMIHDAQFDYYGKLVATCSSDRTVRIHSVDGATHTLQHVLTGHTGPVWQVAWAHPQFGKCLASCSYDGRAIVWREESAGQWAQSYVHAAHSASVNAVAWAPYEFGLMLACASSDGKVSLVVYHQDSATWSVAGEFVAHAVGCNALSWAPSAVPGSLTATLPPSNNPVPLVKKLVTAGCDNLIKIWCDDQGNWNAKPEATLDGHSDWVRDVAWAPNLGMPFSMIASCSQDKTVFVWTQEQGSSTWTKQSLKADKFGDTVWRVTWSDSGCLLAVACGDNKVSLWRQDMEGKWECVNEMDEAAVQATTADVGK